MRKLNAKIRKYPWIYNMKINLLSINFQFCDSHGFHEVTRIIFLQNSKILAIFHDFDFVLIPSDLGLKPHGQKNSSNLKFDFGE